MNTPIAPASDGNPAETSVAASCAEVIEDLRCRLAAERSAARARLEAQGMPRAEIEQVMQQAEELHAQQLIALQVFAEALLERAVAIEAGAQLH